MRVDQFDFDLPHELIALRPVSPRDAARLLVVGAPIHANYHIHDLPGLLQPGDALVFNDTRVIMAALTGTRSREDGAVAEIGINLHQRIDASRWRAFARPAKRLKPGDRIRFGEGNSACLLGALDATIESRDEAEVVLAFDLAGPVLDDAIAAAGNVPLPPYIAGKRPAETADRADYQTVYAKKDGAVAAPTAGLHFTLDLLARLEARGISRHFVTLHVGAGTFLPVKVEDTADHKMHPEWGEVSAKTAAALNAVHARGGRIVAVGTTSLRLLESATREDGTINPFAADTAIFITPGYRFRAVDLLLTNFHLPRSTLVMLVGAFAGMDTMREAYAHAIKERYRFYSYGDASLLVRQP